MQIATTHQAESAIAPFLNRLMAEQDLLKIRLAEGIRIEGRLLAFDSESVLVKGSDDREIMISRNAILYLRPKDERDEKEEAEEKAARERALKEWQELLARND